MGANAKAKANIATAIPALIQIASNPAYKENVLIRYNIFHARLLINHAENNMKYLYDILAIKKKQAGRNRMYGENPFL